MLADLLGTQEPLNPSHSRLPFWSGATSGSKSLDIAPRFLRLFTLESAPLRFGAREAIFISGSLGINDPNVQFAMIGMIPL